MTDISCPVCGAGFDLAVAFACDEERQAFARLASVSIPLGTRVLRYISLFQPPKQRLTSAKKLKLLQQLLPDLERKTIAHKGRDWPAPLDAWAQAFDQMLERRAAGTLELPMKSHGYLYAILAGMADKTEAAHEAKRDEDARLRPQRASVQVRGQALEIGAALGVVYGGKDPALAAIEQRNRAAAPMPAAVRERLNQIKKGA